jgi:flagella basal body P-ring formation protein FlgA
MMPLAAWALTGCLAVSAGAGRILAGDVAAAIPALRVPSPDVPVALAPEPGVQRVFRLPELRRLAVRLGWEGEPAADICFTRPVAPPDPALFLAAMRKTFPQAEIAILEYGRQPLPEGEIEFPASGLHAGGAGGAGENAALWTGWVHYAGTRRFTVWARVKASMAVARWVAAVDLPPGKAIGAGQVRAEMRQEFPAAAPYLGSAGEAVGKWPRVLLRAGTALRAEMLENPKEVARGDTVIVNVRNGGAHLEMEAQAEASGSTGQTVPILNPVSHKRFLARVEGKGKVSVAVSAAQGNP